MIHFVLLFGVLFLGLAVTFVVRALTSSAGPSTETLQQIGAYGFAGSLPDAEGSEPRQSLRTTFGEVATSAGVWVNRRFSRVNSKDTRSRLIAAGMYTTTPERFLGIQLLCAIGGVMLAVLLQGLMGAGPVFLLVLMVAGGISDGLLALAGASGSASSDGRKTRF